MSFTGGKIDPPERLYTQADLDAAVRAAYEDAAKVADMLHQHWAHAKGRNPDDYTSAYSRLRDAIRERGE